MTFNNYLLELLGKQEAKKLKDALKDALKSGKTIIIQGEPQTGKSTFLKVLTNAGYHAVEDFNTYEITLKEPLKNMIPDMLESISEKVDVEWKRFLFHGTKEQQEKLEAALSKDGVSRKTIYMILKYLTINPDCQDILQKQFPDV